MKYQKRDIRISYVPHGVNPDVFYPIDFQNPKDVEVSPGVFEKDVVFYEKTKSSFFSRADVDFLVFFVGRNMRRKNPSDLILGYKHFCDLLPKEKSSKCALLMHTAIADVNGTDLLSVSSNLCPDYKIIFSADYLPPYTMNVLYNLADVTVLPSSNEGFGIPLLESIMAGTMIIGNVTGGIQDQMGFVDENGKFLDVETHYVNDWFSNHDKRYETCGEWAIPVYPSNRSLQGSVETPYIFDDRLKFEHLAIALKKVYDLGRTERKRRGLSGRKYAMNQRIGMNSKEMNRRVIQDIENVIYNFKPVEPFSFYEVTEPPDYAPIDYTISQEDKEAFEMAKQGIYVYR